MPSLFIKRVSIAGIICVVILFFTLDANDANAQFRKGRYVLTGALNWEYETYKFEDNTNKRERVRFLQNYNLNLAGNIIDPRLVNFNAGLKYWLDNADTKDNTSSSDNKTSVLGYNLSLSFFPRTWYPFTIYTDRSTLNTASSLYPTTTAITTSYGANMSLKFTTLPLVEMRYDTTNYKTENPLYPTESETTTYGVVLSKGFKRLWDSSITAGYSSSESEDKTTGAKSTNDAYYLSERSNISQTTSLGISALLNEYKSESSSSTSESQYTSFNATLSMQPYKRFRHSYSYDYSDSESSSAAGAKSETTTNTLSGSAYYLILKEWPIDGRFRYSMTDSSDTNTTATTARNTSTDTLDVAANTTWNPNKDLSTAGSLAYYTQDISGSSRSASTDRIDTAWNAKWAVNKNLSTNASLAYYTEDVSASTGGDSSSKSIAGTAGAGYTTAIRFLNFRSAYNLGYSSVSQDPGDDTKTTTHALSAGMGSSYKGRNLSASGDYDFTYTTSTTGDKGDTHNVSLSAVDTHLPSTVVNASTNWYFGQTATILTSSKSNSRTASLGAVNNYFNNTIINASASYSETHTDTGQISTTYQAGSYTDNRPVLGAVSTGTSESKTTSANASIGRYLGRFGKLSLKGKYLKTEKIGEVIGTAAQTITTKTLEAAHSMWFTKRLGSEISINRTETIDETGDTYTDTLTTTASAALNYKLGKWTASVTYKYLLNDKETNVSTYESKEQTLLFSVTRPFKLFL